MLLDPLTVGAQVVNFLLLVWLLQRVLYGPITRAMREREARVQHELDEARRLRAAAEQEREQHQRELAAFAADRETRLAAARTDVEAWRHAQMNEARQEVDARRARWQGALAEEQRAIIREARQRVGHHVVALTRQALVDLADTSLEERVVARFLERLRELPAPDRERLLTAAREDGQRFHLRTAHALTDGDRTSLDAAIGAALGAPLTTVFEVSPDLGSGVELRAGGLKVGWSLNEYLASLEERLSAAFGDQAADHDHV